MEAWLLGDRAALRKAYPDARENVLQNYIQDSICGTWELLADAVYPGGSRKLKSLPYGETGRMKEEWAVHIARFMDFRNNASPSFQEFLSEVEPAFP